MRYKAVVFDCFGVLYNDILKDLLKRHNVNDPNTIKNCYKIARASDAGKVSLEIFLTDLARFTGLPLETVGVEMSDTSHLNHELADTIKALKPKYKIGMITDVDAELIEPFLNKQNIRDFFDAIVISSEVGSIKPDEQIFKTAIERLGVKPSEIIYIDNSDVNTNAAKTLGMASVLYEDMNQLKHEFHSLLPMANWRALSARITPWDYSI